MLLSARSSLALLLVPAMFSLAPPSAAQACTITDPKPTAFPPPGTQGVSTSTSPVVFGVTSGQIELRTGTQSVALNAPILLGSSTAGQAQIFEPTEMLQPMSTYRVLLRKPGVEGETEVTQFTTGSGYDKEQGTAPEIESLRLWRVRYPTQDIGAGGCLFSEYVGFIEVRWKPASIPNTAPEALLHELSLSPRTGGGAQRHVVLGAAGQLGTPPIEEYPFPIQGWNPELDPTREYCLSIRARGDGDRSRLPSDGNTVCACVQQRSAKGAPAPPLLAQDGCSPAAGSAGGAGGTGGAAGNAAPEEGSEAGCGLAARSNGARGVWPVLLAAAICRRKSRRSEKLV